MSIKVSGNLGFLRVTNFDQFFPSVIAWIPFLMVLFISTFSYRKKCNSLIQVFGRDRDVLE